MQNLGAVMERYGLTNDTAVLIGAEEQLYLCDNSPRAKIGETEHDPWHRGVPHPIIQGGYDVPENAAFSAVPAIPEDLHALASYADCLLTPKDYG